jgi:hypothetical protein
VLTVGVCGGGGFARAEERNTLANAQAELAPVSGGGGCGVLDSGLRMQGMG